VVKSGSSCASACAMALFVSGETRIVQMGGRVGIHSCATADGALAPECNRAMAANALAHGVPWGVIESFGNQTKPSGMMWFGAEEAECWGLMKWSAEDNSNDGIACTKRSVLAIDKRKPAEVSSSMSRRDAMGRVSPTLTAGLANASRRTRRRRSMPPSISSCG
jgi:hypothetical protein